MLIFRIAGGRILSTVKKHLIKGRNSRDPFCQAAEEVVHDLDLRIKNIINSQHEAMTASTTGISPARVIGLLLFSYYLALQESKGLFGNLKYSIILFQLHRIWSFPV